MRRITTPTRWIDKFGAGKDGFRDGDLANSVVPTGLNADWFDQLQEEVAGVVEAAGLTLDGADLSQLLQALNARYALKAGSTGQTFSVALATAAAHAVRMEQFFLTSASAVGTGNVAVSNSFTAPSKGRVLSIGVGNGYGGAGIVFTNVTLAHANNAYASSNGNIQIAVARGDVAAGAAITATFNLANSNGGAVVFSLFIPTV